MPANARRACLLALTFALASGCATPLSWREAEDRRIADPDAFRPALHDPAAVRALGRLASPALRGLLVEALADPATRAIAAWGLGQEGLADGFAPEDARASAVALQALVRDPDPVVRAAVALALGRLRAEPGTAALLADPAPEVRAAALLGLFWHAHLGDVPLADATLAAALALAADPAPPVRATLAVLFSRRPEPRAEATLRALAVADPSATDASSEATLFAVRGLGKLKSPAAETSALLATLAESDPRPEVRTEATLALADATRLPARLATDPDAAVRAAYAMRTTLTPADEPSRWVRALAVTARAKAAFDPARLADPDPLLRAAAAAQLAHAGDAWRPAFDRAFADPDLRVQLAALEALGELGAGTPQAPAAVALLTTLLPTLPASAPLRGAAAEAAKARKSTVLAAPLSALAAASQGPEYIEMRETIAAALAELEAWSALAALAADPAPSVRAAAARALAQHENRPVPIVDRTRAATPLAPGPTAAELAFDTDRGTFVIALDRDRAPTTTAAISALVRRGFYDGLRFHRLVPNFVVQGGDPTGTGWGDAGLQLPDEVSELPFDAGTVGLAKAGPDTGSCQLFVTLASTPHLAGRYTALGRVIQGMDVVRALELDDVIRHARIVR